MLTASISYHIQEFLVAPSIFFNPSYPKFNKYERNWQSFDHENLILDYFSVDWDNVLFASNMVTEKSKEPFLEVWLFAWHFLTSRLQKYVSIKNTIFQSLFDWKSPVKNNKLKMIQIIQKPLISADNSILLDFVKKILKV